MTGENTEFSSCFRMIGELERQYLDLWREIAMIESPTDSKTGVDAVADALAAAARTRGWKVEREPMEIAGDVLCVTLNPEVPAAPLVLSGHIDTVHPIGSFGSPAVRIEDGLIYGPGVCDCKGGVVAAFLAMDALDRCGYRSRPVMLLTQSDEETNSQQSGKATIRLICEKAKNAVAFLNLEPLSHNRDTACIARKGILEYRFTVTGVAAHSSMVATEGANAIAEAAYKIPEIERYKDADGITCCCGLIEGGTASNAVPDRCSFTVNIRYATAEQREWIDKRMREIAGETRIKGCWTELTLLTHRTAMEYTDRNADLLVRLNRAFSACGLPTLKPGSSKGGSDAADVTAYGIPCVDSLGVSGGKIHSRGEFAEIASLAEAAKRIVAVAVQKSVAEVG